MLTISINLTLCIGYACRADKNPYRHDRRADKNPYRHDRRADSQCLSVRSFANLPRLVVDWSEGSIGSFCLFCCVLIIRPAVRSFFYP